MLLLKRFEQRGSSPCIWNSSLHYLLYEKHWSPIIKLLNLQCVYYILGKISEFASLISLLCGFISKVLIFLSLGGERNSNSVFFFFEFWGRWEVLWNHQCCSLEPNPFSWWHWLRFIIFFWTKFGEFFVALLNMSARRRCCSHSCHFTRDHWDHRRKNNQLLINERSSAHFLCAQFCTGWYKGIQVYRTWSLSLKKLKDPAWEWLPLHLKWQWTRQDNVLWCWCYIRINRQPWQSSG